MKKPTVLFVDDQVSIHVIVKAMLNKNYDLEFASNAQEAIDLVSAIPVNLILLDIELPELSGLELLESLMIDTTLNDVPVVILTGKATEEREQKAKNLGAAAFVSKDKLLTEEGKQSLAKIIENNITESASRPAQDTDFKKVGKLIIRNLVKDSKKKDFFFVARRFSVNLMKYFDIEYLSIWSVQKGRPNMLISMGDLQPPDFGPEDIKKEPAFKTLFIKRTSYMTNNANCPGKTGIFANLAMESGLSSEIGIPMFKISRENLSKNRMLVPKNTPAYSFIILKRNHVFTTKEYKLLVKVITYCGSILWNLYRNMFAE